MKKKWYKQKTTWTGISGIIGSVAGVVTGVVTLPVALPTIITSLVGIFLRQGVENLKD
jgi:uncharacterized membrane protein HdeD (DUF308 family)